MLTIYMLRYEGWNNIRMAMETALVMSHAMGRTLVLPPEQKMYLLQNGDKAQKKHFGFNDFFHLDAISVCSIPT